MPSAEKPTPKSRREARKRRLQSRTTKETLQAEPNPEDNDWNKVTHDDLDEEPWELVSNNTKDHDNNTLLQGEWKSLNVDNKTKQGSKKKFVPLDLNETNGAGSSNQ